MVLLIIVSAGCIGTEEKSNTTGLPNPAAVYCQKMGYEYRIVTDSGGQRGECQMDGQWFDEWVIYQGGIRAECESTGGNWNECGNKCSIDNQGKEGAACTLQCEMLCECGGIAGFRCPAGYECKMPEGIADALGYCEPIDGGNTCVGCDRDEHGCIGSAGYSWCQEKQKCVRSWEENCSDYTIAKTTGERCSQDADCITPGEYLVLSHCPYTSKCIEGKCAVVCPFPFTAAKPEEIIGGGVGMPNPAAVYCQKQGYEYRIVTDADGSQRGECKTAEGVWVDEWALYNKGIDITQPPEESGPAKECENAGGHWNECGSTCGIDNQGKDVACPAICNSICECGGKAALRCQQGYACRTPPRIANASGYCVQVQGGGGAKMSLTEARKIAEGSDCTKKGTLTKRITYNNVTGTWWFDLEMREEYRTKDCNPACVVAEETKTAEINWRCTGLIPSPIKEPFCGTSTNGSCTEDEDCVTGGCSGQVCQGRTEEPVITTCEYRDCYRAIDYGLGCKCVDKKCQWA